MIVSRAACTLALSPPDVIHLKPPQIRKRSATTAAITRIPIIAFRSNGPAPEPLIRHGLYLESVGANASAPWHGSRFTAAKTGCVEIKTKERNRERAKKTESSFFIVYLADHA